MVSKPLCATYATFWLKIVLFREFMYLLSHWLRVGNSCAEEAVPLQPAVESGPVIVAVPSVRQTPGDQGVKLPVCRVTRLPYDEA